VPETEEGGRHDGCPPRRGYRLHSICRGVIPWGRDRGQRGGEHHMGRSLGAYFGNGSAVVPFVALLSGLHLHARFELGSGVLRCLGHRVGGHRWPELRRHMERWRGSQLDCLLGCLDAVGLRLVLWDENNRVQRRFERDFLCCDYGRHLPGVVGVGGLLAGKGRFVGATQ